MGVNPDIETHHHRTDMSGDLRVASATGSDQIKPRSTLLIREAYGQLYILRIVHSCQILFNADLPPHRVERLAADDTAE